MLLRIRITDTTELDRITFGLNGEALPNSALRIINQMFWMSGPRRTAQGYWFVFTLDRDSWPRQGTNTLQITLVERDPDVTPPVVVQDVELETKYLMGKHFRRGHDDPALGPFEGRMGGQLVVCGYASGRSPDLRGCFRVDCRDRIDLRTSTLWLRCDAVMKLPEH